MAEEEGEPSQRRRYSLDLSDRRARIASHLGISSKNLDAVRDLIETLGVDKLVEVRDLIETLGADKFVEVGRLEANQQEQVKKEVRPSELVHRSIWKNLQFTGDAPAFICYRGPPSKVYPSIPVALVHKSFLDFRMHAAASSDVEAEDMDAAFNLWQSCTRGWDHEVQDMMPQLNVFFTEYLHLFVDSGQMTDGQALLGDALIIFEYKIELADGFFQGLQYFKRFFLRKHHSHGLLVLLACPYIQVVAVVMDWEQGKVVAEPLSSLQNCFGSHHEVRQLASLLRALRIFVNDYTVDPGIKLDVPFVLRGRAPRKLQGRLVYQVADDRVCKLTRSYCEEAHKQWAANNIAPHLYDVRPIGDGWFHVEMTFLDSKNGWIDAEEVVSSCKDDPDALAELVKCVNEAVLKGHSTGYVHGDLRLPNMKIHKKYASYEVMFVDFDWAGEIGQATYPSLLNPDLGWHEDVKYGKKIEVHHDLHFASRLVEQLPQIHISLPIQM